MCHSERDLACAAVLSPIDDAATRIDILDIHREQSYSGAKADLTMPEISKADGHEMTRVTISSHSALSDYLLHAAAPALRIVYDLPVAKEELSIFYSALTVCRSICARNSLQPLQITRKSLDLLTTHHDIGPQLLDILLAFGHTPRQSESGMGIMNLQQRPTGMHSKSYWMYMCAAIETVLDMTYVLRYAEQDSEHS